MVKSNLADAQAAVAGFKTVDENIVRTFNAGKSQIKGMREADETSYEMLHTVSKLAKEIKKQADKFPELATVIEARDKEDANDLSDMCWGF